MPLSYQKIDEKLERKLFSFLTQTQEFNGKKLGILYATEKR